MATGALSAGGRGGTVGEAQHGDAHSVGGCTRLLVQSQQGRGGEAVQRTATVIACSEGDT